MNGWQRMSVGAVLVLLCLGSWWWHIREAERISRIGNEKDRYEDDKSAWYQTYSNCRERPHDLSGDLDQSRDCAREAFAANRARR
jgi:hypothetical protein